MVFVKLLGEGSQGSVSLYNHTRYDGKVSYAVMKMSDHLNADSLYNEIQILSKLKGCPRIVQVYGDKLLESFDDKGNKVYKMFIEYAPGGSLSSLMDSFKDKKLPDPMIREFTYMLLEGLASIHDHGYVHSDLKPENILVFPSTASKCGYELKIADFGLSRRDGDESWWTSYFPFAGTPIYMSPESIDYGESGKGLDIWSLGCIVLEMYTGKQPWFHTDYNLKDLAKGHQPLIPNDLPVDAEYCIKTCFSLHTEERGEASKLLDHVFLRGYVKQKKDLDGERKAKRARKQPRSCLANAYKCVLRGLRSFISC